MTATFRTQETTTAVDSSGDQLRLVSIIFTPNVLQPVVDSIVALPDFRSAGCDAADGILSDGGGPVPGDSDADTFGDDPFFDRWTDCDDGDMVACDDLYYTSPIGSDYEYFGAMTDTAEALYRVVDAAYEKRSVALSSNLHPAGFDDLMPKTIANATVDRLMHHAHLVLTDGASIRLTQATAGKGVTPLDYTP